MKPLITDTPPEIERRVFDGYRAMPQARKIEIICDMFRFGRTLHAAGYRHRNPQATNRDVLADWLRQLYGYVPPVKWPEEERMALSNADSLPHLKQVLDAFRRMNLLFAVGGSWASSIHGEPRLSNDADVTVEPFPGREEEFLRSFGDDWYFSIDAIREANQNRSAFNMLYTAAGFKVDVFVQKLRPFDRLLIARRVLGSVPDVPGETLEVVSPEDSILLKLEWYRLGGGISDQQWRDILGIFKTQKDRLDDAYLDQWAAALGVSDLLQQARADAVIP
jgi:hypothetical protein